MVSVANPPSMPIPIWTVEIRKPRLPTRKHRGRWEIVLIEFPLFRISNRSIAGGVAAAVAAATPHPPGADDDTAVVVWVDCCAK